MHMSSAKSSVKRITCEHLLQIEKQPADNKAHVVVDIRDLPEYETGHIAGSLHVPRRELTDNLPNLVPDKDKRVVVILGPTDEEEIEDVHDKLIDAGYKNVEYLAGGIDRYCEIADVELDDVLGEMTDEERLAAGHGEADIDPEGHDNEPLY